VIIAATETEIQKSFSEVVEFYSVFKVFYSFLTFAKNQHFLIRLSLNENIKDVLDFISKSTEISSDVGVYFKGIKLDPSETIGSVKFIF
jgi:hypothetical protein